MLVLQQYSRDEDIFYCLHLVHLHWHQLHWGQREKYMIWLELTNNILLHEEQFSLFSVVQFPNEECTSGNTNTNGTCFTTSECGSRGGAASGSCAAGFGVCCVISSTTCGSTISTNTSYIRNPGYPSTYTPPNAGSCTFTIRKVSDNICQLRFGIIYSILLPSSLKFLQYIKETERKENLHRRRRAIVCTFPDPPPRLDFQSFSGFNDVWKSSLGVG